MPVAPTLVWYLYGFSGGERVALLSPRAQEWRENPTLHEQRTLWPKPLFTDSDLALFMAYRNDSEVARYQGWEGISEPEARVFLQEQKEVQPGAPGHWFQIAVELKETGMLVGDCALKMEEHDERQAEFGSTLSRAYQGRGIASEAVSCVLEYAFVTLGLHRVIAMTACENAGSVTLLERLGLRREGHFRQNVWLKGKWRDEFLYAMLQEEWRSTRSTNRLM